MSASIAPTETRIASNGYAVHIYDNGSVQVESDGQIVGGIAGSAKFWCRLHDANEDRRGWLPHPRMHLNQQGTRINVGSFNSAHYAAGIEAVKEVTSHRWGRA